MSPPLLYFSFENKLCQLVGLAKVADFLFCGECTDDANAACISRKTKVNSIFYLNEHHCTTQRYGHGLGP